MSGSGARRAPRYRVVAYQLDTGHEVKVMDATGAGFVAAVGTIHDGAMQGELGDGGPRALTQHIAILIAGEYPPERPGQPGSAPRSPPGRPR